MNSKQRPVGELVKAVAVKKPQAKIFSGQFVELQPLAQSHSEQLFHASHGSEEKEAIWTYMPFSGPFESLEQMSNWVTQSIARDDFIFFAVIDKKSSQAIGMLGYCGMVPDMRRVEIGFVWYTPTAQRSKVNTEAVYLLLAEAFNMLDYRRVEWKCDSLNARSRAAALRLGFSFEGIFEKHMIVNGRNRDTAWFAMLEQHWPAIENNLRHYLYEAAENVSLRALNADLVRQQPLC